MSEGDIKETVREKYARAALRVVSGESACCGTTSRDGTWPTRTSQASSRCSGTTNGALSSAPREGPRSSPPLRIDSGVVRKYG